MKHKVPEPELARDPAATRRSADAVSVRVRPGTPIIIFTDTRTAGALTGLENRDDLTKVVGVRSSPCPPSCCGRRVRRWVEAPVILVRLQATGPFSRMFDRVATCQFAKLRPTLTGGAGSNPAASARFHNVSAAMWEYVLHWVVTPEHKNHSGFKSHLTHHHAEVR